MSAFCDKSEFVAVNVKRRAHPVMGVRARNYRNGAVPDESRGALESFTQNRFLNLKLALVTNVLPVAAAGGFVIGAARSLAVG